MKWILSLVVLMLSVAPMRAEDVTLVDTPRVRMSIDRATGRWQITDRPTARVWTSNPDQPRFGFAMIPVDAKPQRADLVPADVQAGKESSTIVFRPAKGSDREIRVTIAPLADGLAFSCTRDRDWEVESVRLLDDALAVTARQQGAVLVPVRLGLLIPADSGKAFANTFNTSSYEGCHMNMLGVMDKQGTVLLTWDDPYVSAEVKSITPAGAPQRLTVSLGMRKSANSFQIHFPGAGDHVTIARAYRQIAEKRPGFVTMARKIAQNAEREKLLGASNVKLWSALSRQMNDQSTKEDRVRVNWTFDEAAQVAEHLKNDLKLDRVLFTVGGWIHRGYDNQHPDVLPAAPECGGDAKLAEMSARVMKLGYLLCLHDNYQDMYKDSPSWDENVLQRRADGKIAVGGKWAGGRAYLTCAQQAVALAKRSQNLPAVRELTRANSYFIDTTYAADLQECFSKDHPLTRLDDMKWKCELSDYARSLFGSFGSECGREWAIPHADFFEGLTGVSGKSYHNAALEETLGAKVVPLFEMVYHDTIQMYGKYGYDHWKSAEYVLRHILIARPLNYHSIPSHLYWKTLASDPAPLAIDRGVFVRATGGWAEELCATDRFLKNTHEILSPLNALTSKLPMTSHRFLKPDGSVQESIFGDSAVRVTVNYGPDTYTVPSPRCDTVKLPQFGFLVESPTFIAFCADSLGGKTYDAPAMFTLASRDGLPVEQSAKVRIFHAFGDPEVRLGGKTWTVKRELE
ncbi:MAG: DUF5696 domain-containing protein [Tepidisphaeraceae bacterium]|jgi:hypothetical protein